MTRGQRFKTWMISYMHYRSVKLPGGSSPCRMLIIRNGNVALAVIRNGNVVLLIFKEMVMSPC